ncbi:MAG: PHP domain-containing protein, partial [Actinobacteria bacterium]|nr:PHP domain-containing protein [Actinomycetota bacterium]
MRIDLHAHSTASDGTDSPAALVRAAAAAGLDVVAITDHDTTAGWAEAAEALAPGLRLIRGAEFSCESPDGRGGSVSVHLLGYLFDPQSPSIAAEQARLRNERRRRLRVMAERMAAEGFGVDPDALLDGLPADAPAGRPHLAAALLAAGVVG